MEGMLPGIASIEDLRRAARRRLPKMVFDYIDGGADEERTMRANMEAFGEITWRPKGAVRLETVETRTTVLSQELAFPVILAPVGSSRMFWPEGEAAAARAAGKAGIIYTLSTLSGTRLEEVRAASTGACWYQLYLCGGREVAESALARAQAAGYSALVLTIDTPLSGMRERDLRNGTPQLISGRLPDMLPFLPQLLARPGWLLEFWRTGGAMTFPNVMLPDGPMGYTNIDAQLSASAVSWSDVQWIREAWPGPLIIKGVHVGDDARRAADVGASAVVVSNHGGRQLDGVAPTLHALPEVVKAAGDSLEVLLDGGVRRGADVATAVALGARAVLVGRPYAYGLGAAGEAGVTAAISILRDGLERTLRLLGVSSVHELTSDYYSLPAGWPG